VKTAKTITPLLTLCFLLLACIAPGQERTTSLQYNPQLRAKQKGNALGKKTNTTVVLNLPFFEDFTGYYTYPDSTKWTDNHVFINNTMCVNPVSRGVATMDVLNDVGYPWDPWGSEGIRQCDSLTSQPINMSLSLVSPADSVYLSFFYQPQGNGFYPLPQDSLMLMFRTKYGGWEKIWEIQGSSQQPFQQVMIPITDSLYYSDTFQFRFINLGSLNLSDAIWNLDYIRLNKNRSYTDTAVSDVAFTSDPTPLLNDYYSMPYRQFLANPTSETALQYYDSIHNATNAPQPLTYWFTARALNTGTTLQPPVSSTPLSNAYSVQQQSNTAYTTTIPLTGIHDRVVFENKYYIESTTATGPTDNDTILHDQVFDNYLAYDDGTAEQAYYLNLYPTQPGMLAIEHHLNTDDTMQGMAIYFGREVPGSVSEVFTLMVYSSLAGVNGGTSDDTLLTQQLCSPGFKDTVNHFWVYKFDRPLPMHAGTFYAGTLQPADFGSDSLYFGFDVNRRGGNHAYYNVLGSWNPSLLAGAIMIRPLFGQTIISSHVTDVYTKQPDWQVTPNPATDRLNFTFKNDVQATYHMLNIQGQPVMSGEVTSGNSIDISTLPSGMYFVNITVNGVASAPVKVVKL